MIRLSSTLIRPAPISKFSKPLAPPCDDCSLVLVAVSFQSKVVDIVFSPYVSSSGLHYLIQVIGSVYSQASQSGSVMEHAFCVVNLTAFNAPSLIVDFSALLAPMLRK